MTIAMTEILRSSILLDAIREIEEIANDAADITNNGGLNTAMRIAQIAREAAAKVNNTAHSKGDGHSDG